MPARSSRFSAGCAIEVEAGEVAAADHDRPAAGLVLNGTTIAPSSSGRYSCPPSHTVASLTGLLASSTTCTSWPAVLVRTSGRSRPLRISARLLLPPNR